MINVPIFVGIPPRISIVVTGILGGGATWRIIQVSKWLITMVSKSPSPSKWPIFMACKWAVIRSPLTSTGWTMAAERWTMAACNLSSL